MTTSEILGVMRRRWYVAVLGIAVLMGALHVIASRPGVYSTQVDVVILSPKSARFPNVIEQTSASLIAVAGLIEREVNKGIQVPATASASVTLAGVGVREGHAITLPNSGGQWANSFSRPVLALQVVGPTEAAVRAELTSLVKLVERRLVALQEADQIPQVTRITASPAPTSPEVFLLDGNRKKAMGAALLLGVPLIAIATVGADTFLNGQARRRRRIHKIYHPRGNP